MNSTLQSSITLVINQSLKTGMYPDKLKIAKVMPVYKKGETMYLIIMSQYPNNRQYQKSLKLSSMSNYMNITY